MVGTKLYRARGRGAGPHGFSAAAGVSTGKGRQGGQRSPLGPLAAWRAQLADPACLRVSRCPIPDFPGDPEFAGFEDLAKFPWEGEVEAGPR